MKLSGIQKERVNLLLSFIGLAPLKILDLGEKPCQGQTVANLESVSVRTKKKFITDTSYVIR